MKKYFTDRSRIETHLECPRRRFLTYQEAGTGITPKNKPLPLVVGGAVHRGLEHLLREGSAQWAMDGHLSMAHTLEDDAVKAALADFRRFTGMLELDAIESSAMTPTPESEKWKQQLLAQAKELGMTDEQAAEMVSSEGDRRGDVKTEFDRYLEAEQAAQVEAMVRAYARRRLQPLLEKFEVLEVEREGEWKLSEWNSPVYGDLHTELRYASELWFMSRPDALLRERSSNELYILSYKTTAGWDVRKEKTAEHDMQGLSEGVEVERRLGEWWRQIKSPDTYKDALAFNIPTPIYLYLKGLEAPPRVHAIRYEYLLKGDRRKDRELSLRLGVEARSQQSHLIRAYTAVSTPKKGESGYSLGDVCWSWDFTRTEDDKSSTLAWQNWKSQPVWQQKSVGTGTTGTTGMIDLISGVKDWIDLLDRSEEVWSGADSTVGMEPRRLGWSSPGQKLGVTDRHPLDAAFLPPVTVYRNDDELRDWVESTEEQERTAAIHAEEVLAARDGGERRSLLNRYFPMNRGSCQYPSQCPFADPLRGVCFGPQEVRENPLGSGEYVRRVMNHPQELPDGDLTRERAAGSGDVR